MNQDLALSFIKEIKGQGLVVPQIEISKLGGLSFASVFTERPTEVMANSASAGVDYNSDLAITKALVEHFERQVFSEGIAIGNPVCFRRHSDGVAAYPRSKINADTQARENAYCEALERYVWARWWDDHSVGHTRTFFENSEFFCNEKFRITIEDLNKIISLDSISVIEPFFEESQNDVLILFAAVKNFGYISGGAAGPTDNRDEIFLRGLAELIRHGIALSRFIETKQSPKTFYEKRLLLFGLGHGNESVNERLQNISNNNLKLPSLEFDNVIESKKYSGLITTHRCLFKDQPPFVDGDLERLCL